MKKLMNKITFGTIVLMTSVPAFAAAAGGGANGVCQLIVKLQDIFKLLRTLAFVGAAFYIAGWAWDFISKGEAKPEEIKKKGQGLLVGFILLFMIGVVISFVLSAAGGENAIWCKDVLTSNNW